jgi:hypothetical protein
MLQKEILLLIFCVTTTAETTAGDLLFCSRESAEKQRGAAEKQQGICCKTAGHLLKTSRLLT